MIKESSSVGPNVLGERRINPEENQTFINEVALNKNLYEESDDSEEDDEIMTDIPVHPSLNNLDMNIDPNYRP